MFRPASTSTSALSARAHSRKNMRVSVSNLQTWYPILIILMRTNLKSSLIAGTRTHALLLTCQAPPLSQLSSRFVHFLVWKLPTLCFSYNCTCLGYIIFMYWKLRFLVGIKAILCTMVIMGFIIRNSIICWSIRIG